MEPNKMEKDFKQKLEQRTIQPSDMAWDRLDAMLSVAENKKPKKNRTWMYMAAAFLVFLLVGVLFLNQEKENSGIDANSSVVTTEGEQTQTATGTENNETFTAPVTNQEAVAVQGQSTSTGSNKISGSKRDIISNGTTGQPMEQEVFAANDKKTPSVIVPSNDTEKLLAATAPTETAKKKHGVKVDPNALLSAAEEELDDSFKDKVLIGAVKNFDAVRSAVANRNYE